MGNWRTVQIVGRCNNDDAWKLKKAINPSKGFHCLMNGGGICGLGDWVQEKIYAIGNLAERDYTVDDVADQLRKLAKIAPFLDIRVHCGGENENKRCVSTIKVVHGHVVIQKPRIKTLPEIPRGQLEMNLMRALT